MADGEWHIANTPPDRISIGRRVVNEWLYMLRLQPRGRGRGAEQARDRTLFVSGCFRQQTHGENLIGIQRLDR